MMGVDEKELWRRASGEKPFNYKTIRYLDESTLMDEVKQLYPTVSHIIIVELDNRDLEGKPLITMRMIRGINIHTTISKNWSGQTTSRVEASWVNVLCIVEKGQVTLRSFKESLGDSS